MGMIVQTVSLDSTTCYSRMPHLCNICRMTLKEAIVTALRNFLGE